ncbi:hypothetical protein NE237_004707 [Protea cynaroides]|uniref:Uncharacterized protein n=1 Tax=Protea cynaroides TaxID=273540 RepID=A0A9Q0QTS7_9MAGN|nr:hypothetical protein NE237_004707 [Protea cynaroides]
MADTNTNSTLKRLAVVIGANKGIGLEISRQLASNGVAMILTARDEKKGTVEAVEKLKESGLSNVIFHQLDVKEPVNNAGVSGIILDDDAYETPMAVDGSQDDKVAKLRQLVKQTYETAEECLQANYYGPKRVTEALLPILQLSDSPRIVNVSSSLGKLENISYTWINSWLDKPDNVRRAASHSLTARKSHEIHEMRPKISDKTRDEQRTATDTGNATPAPLSMEGAGAGASTASWAETKAAAEKITKTKSITVAMEVLICAIEIQKTVYIEMNTSMATVILFVFVIFSAVAMVSAVEAPAPAPSMDNGAGVTLPVSVAVLCSSLVLSLILGLFKH